MTIRALPTTEARQRTATKCASFLNRTSAQSRNRATGRISPPISASPNRKVSRPGPGAHPKKVLKITSTLPAARLKIVLNRPGPLCRRR